MWVWWHTEGRRPGSGPIPEDPPRNLTRYDHDGCVLPSRVHCCYAGATACPDACPWHDPPQVRGLPDWVVRGEDPPDTSQWEPEEVRAARIREILPPGLTMWTRPGAGSRVDAVLLLVGLVFAAGLLLGALLW